MSKMRVITLKNFPEGMPNPDRDFKMEQRDRPQPTEGQALVKVLLLSVDPYMRYILSPESKKIQIGQILQGGGVGEVVESRSPGLKKGDLIVCQMDWGEYSIVDADEARKPSPWKLWQWGKETQGLPLSHALGVLGMPGLTAYFGLLEVGKPKQGETVVVDAAAGAVGSMVGQIAKLKGCRVIGIAGSDEKINCLHKLGFDGAINYKKENVREALKRLIPHGVDVFYDNVAGDVSDAVFELMKPHGRVVCCGSVSSYNDKQIPKGPRREWAMITHSLRMEGFMVDQFAERFEEGRREIIQWLKAGKLKFHETTREGLENTPKAFTELLQGGNIGKMVVKVAEHTGAGREE